MGRRNVSGETARPPRALWTMQRQMGEFPVFVLKLFFGSHQEEEKLTFSLEGIGLWRLLVLHAGLGRSVSPKSPLGSGRGESTDVLVTTVECDSKKPFCENCTK